MLAKNGLCQRFCCSKSKSLTFIIVCVCDAAKSAAQMERTKCILEKTNYDDFLQSFVRSFVQLPTYFLSSNSSLCSMHGWIRLRLWTSSFGQWLARGRPNYRDQSYLYASLGGVVQKKLDLCGLMLETFSFSLLNEPFPGFFFFSVHLTESNFSCSFSVGIRTTDLESQKRLFCQTATRAHSFILKEAIVHVNKADQT